MLSLIVAVSDNYVIGNKNELPWRLSADLKHFKEITTGHTVIMGRKTYESIGRPLPNRVNIIVTRNKDYGVEGCEIANSLEEAMSLSEDTNSFIIGGSNIYEQSMDMVDTLYITHVHANIEGDAHFPEIDTDVWEELNREDYKADEKNDHDYSFVKYGRI